MFLVSPAGIVVTDPINADAAQWLKSELARRFDQPVKYLIYSHDHVDHSSGGEVFGDGVTVIAHDNAKAAIIGENRPTAVLDITLSDQFMLELGGKTVAQMQQAISTCDHADWEGDAAQLPLNMEGMYNQISLHRRGN